MQHEHQEHMENLTITILRDEWGHDEADLCDMLGTFYHWHKRGFYCGEDISRLDSHSDFIKEHREQGAIVAPVYLYEHSGQTISGAPFSCSWDSGQMGVWIITPEEIKNEYREDTPKNREIALKVIQDQIEHINDILTGNVWGFVVEDEDKEEISSCWGFYGDYEAEYGALSEAKAEALHYLQQKRKGRLNRLKTLIKNSVPLQLRPNILAGA